MNYCFFCGYDTETAYKVCYTCKAMTGVEYTYTPESCNDMICYVVGSEFNFDSADCEHESLFNALCEMTA